MSEPVQFWRPVPRPELVGARWSTAVRCVAKAEYQALGFKGDANAQLALADAFARGINAADNWVEQMRRNYGIAGLAIETEVPISWGPNGIWTGHADIVVPGDKLVLEAYHSVGGDFRQEKALQVAFYARKLGPDYRAMLQALDTTKLIGEHGFEMTSYAVDVDGLGPTVDDMERRIMQAYADGEVNGADRVGDSPEHPECKMCQFRETCWEDFRPQPVEDVPELIDWLDRLVLAQANSRALREAHAEAESLVRELRSLVRPYIQPGQTIKAGEILAKRILTAPRRGFRLTDYLKAGHPLTPTMADFATESDHEGERWYIKRTDGS